MIRTGRRAGVAGGVLLALAFGAVLAPPTRVAAADSPGNLLDRPMADVAILPAADGGTPDLLALEASDGGSSTIRLDLMRRASVWVDAVSHDVDLGPTPLPDRWLVALGSDRYALIASSSPDGAPTGNAVAVVLAIDPEPKPGIREVARQTFDRAIEYAGAADVDGFGSPELVLGMRIAYDTRGTCGTTSLVVVDGAVAAVRRLIDLPGWLGAGVLGRFDGRPGDDLLVYTAPDCPASGWVDSRLRTVNLIDGREASALAAPLHGDVSTFPPPLRIDLEGRASDQVLAMTDDGLAALDPRARTPQLLLAGVGSVPLLVTSSGGDAAAGARIALLDSAGIGGLVVGDLQRAGGALRWKRRSELDGGDTATARWAVVTASMRAAAKAGDPAAAWSGDAVTPGCHDLVVPGGIMPCGSDALRSGAAWLATRPIAAVPIEGQRDVLVAAGLDWTTTGLPRSPSPVAAAPAGWWRHGPSAPFALSEVRSEDLVYFREFPTPTATIEATTASDGSTALPGFTGARLFTAVTPLAEGQDPPTPADSVLTALNADPGTSGRKVVVRVPVPPGLGSGRDGSFARLGLGSVRIGDAPTTRWAMQVVPINDWGEWGPPVASVIARDAIGPTVDVEDPFLSAIWPITTRLSGRTEPGSTVQVDGHGAIQVDRRGRFDIDGALAPWPQTIHVTATDDAGNVTVAEFTVIGGIDYRRLPWPGIIAAVLLAVVALRGLVGGRRDRETGVEATRWSTGMLDEGSIPEIEELPPGGGLARS